MNEFKKIAQKMLAFLNNFVYNYNISNTKKQTETSKFIKLL